MPTCELQPTEGTRKLENHEMGHQGEAMIQLEMPLEKTESNKAMMALKLA